jgi:ribosome biogenesis protein MAK21
VASNAAFLLAQTLEEHGAMSLVVAREVEGFLFRPGVTPRARYTAIVFLNQLTLSHRPADKAVAARLIAAYFAVFKQLIKENEAADKKAGSPGAHIPDVDARLASAILTGVRRAFPYVEQSVADKLIAEHTPHLFALAHHERSFPTAVQALCLLHQLLAAHAAISDRFYRALYAALLQPALPTSTKASMLLALLFKAVKEDVSDKRAAAFVKRLLQVRRHPTLRLK